MNRSKSFVDSAPEFWRAFEQARQVWPQFQNEPAEFLEYLNSRLPNNGQLAHLEKFYIADLYLSFACLSGNKAAWAALEGLLKQHALPCAQKVAGDLADDIIQALRQSLIQKPSRLEKYGGIGPLSGWLTTVVAHLVVTEFRRHHREVLVEDFHIFEGHAESPELSWLKQNNRVEFQKAVREAFGGLSPRDRTVLRLNFQQGLNIDQIGRIYGVHRATVARWIAQARQHIYEATHRFLKARHSYSPEEVQSIVRALQGDSDLSLSSLLMSIHS